MTDSEMIASAIFGTKHIILYVVILAVLVGGVAMTMRRGRS
jgi:cytochrome b561